MVCPCTLYSACVVYLGTSELGGQQSLELAALNQLSKWLVVKTVDVSFTHIIPQSHQSCCQVYFNRIANKEQIQYLQAQRMEFVTSQ